MSRFGTKNGIFLIVTLAAAGCCWSGFRRGWSSNTTGSRQLGPPWTYFYFALVGTGAAILLTLTA